MEDYLWYKTMGSLVYKSINQSINYKSLADERVVSVFGFTTNMVFSTFLIYMDVASLMSSTGL